MKRRHSFRQVTIKPAEHVGICWETKHAREEVLFFRVQTKEPVALIYVERVAVGTWSLCEFRLPLESLLARLERFPMWSYPLELSLELSNAGAHDCEFLIRPVCSGDDVDGAS